MDLINEILSSRPSSRPSSRVAAYFEDDQSDAFLLPSLDSQRTTFRSAGMSARPSSRTGNTARSGKKKKNQIGRFPTGDRGDDGNGTGRSSAMRYRNSFQALDMIERNMVVALLKESIERLSLIQEVGVHITKEKKEFEFRFGEEIDKVLAHQQMLEKRYSKLIEERKHALKLMSQKLMVEDITRVTHQLKENEKQRQEIREEIRKKRDMLDQYFEKKAPDIQQYVGKISRQINMAIRSMVSLMKEVNRDGSFVSIIDSIADERMNLQRNFMTFIAEESSLIDQFKQLRAQTSSIMEDSMKDFHDMDKTIADLELKLNFHRKINSVFDQYAQRQYEMDYETVARIEDHKLGLLTEKKDTVIKKKMMEQKNETHMIDFLLKKKDGYDQERKQWEERYTTEFAIKDAELTHLKHRCDTLKEARLAAETKYEDYARRIERIRDHRYRQKMESLFEAAATVIQAAWRGYSLRKSLPAAFRRRFLRRRELRNISSPMVASQGDAQRPKDSIPIQSAEHNPVVKSSKKKSSTKRYGAPVFRSSSRAGRKTG